MIGELNFCPGAYISSALHSPGRIFRETNCYLDIWIELLHASGIDPASAMAFACATAFEGDQWTFLKPPASELHKLFGIDVHEIQFYRAPITHAVECLEAGGTMIVEVDAFYLPDTAGSSYQQAHAKSSIAIGAIDPAKERLRYFHGTGYFELSGCDYRGVFRLGRPYSDDVLMPYVEVVRFDAGPRLSGEALRNAALESLSIQLNRAPVENPWLAFGNRLDGDLPQLLKGSEADYHAYAFATVRQCGAAFEIAKTFVEWLVQEPEPHTSAAIEALHTQAEGAKSLLFKLARRRHFDASPKIAELAQAWETGMRQLKCAAFGVLRHAL